MRRNRKIRRKNRTKITRSRMSNQVAKKKKREDTRMRKNKLKMKKNRNREVRIVLRNRGCRKKSNCRSKSR